jgi:hypothetical protein
MKEKINIAELLKDCPRGMELYSPLCGKCVFDRLNSGTIICKKQNTQEITFTCEGYYMLPVFDNCECMIFPSKDQRDWSKFQRPFKNGDIVFTTLGNIAIIRKPIGEELFCVYGIMVGNGFYKDEPAKVVVERHATEEEKQKLFAAIKENGYKWNEETKTLEKLSKFKAGDVLVSDNEEDIFRFIEQFCLIKDKKTNSYKPIKLSNIQKEFINYINKNNHGTISNQRSRNKR